MKDESLGMPIIEFIGLRAKMYFFLEGKRIALVCNDGSLVHTVKVRTYTSIYILHHVDRQTDTRVFQNNNGIGVRIYTLGSYDIFILLNDR